MRQKRIVFLTGTRADFGKLKSLIIRLRDNTDCEIHVFVTGMHMMSKYGYTVLEVERCQLGNSYKFINQNSNDTMDAVLGKTIAGFSDYVKEIRPDMIVVHGDRVEALAGAIVGSLNNILVSHIEGGEVSGTIDELIRHAVSKMSHVHFVANEEARKRLLQMGEKGESIQIIGSPDYDIMVSPSLPTMEEVARKYELSFESFAIVGFHPVTTLGKENRNLARVLVDVLIESQLNYVVIYPNNDFGSDDILEEYERLRGNEHIAIFPSMRFEYFLTLMKNSKFMIGNSSAGVREAPFYGVPSIDIGNRQFNRVSNTDSIVRCEFDKGEILEAIGKVQTLKPKPVALFGEGDSDKKFVEILSNEKFWETSVQKNFIDLR